MTTPPASAPARPALAALSCALLAGLAFAGAARAGSLSGTAIPPGPVNLPPEAVFEALLIDAALQDAPAPVLGRFVRQPVGRPPFRFTIPYREADLTPAGRYALQVRVRQCERLLYTNDTFTPVLSGRDPSPVTVRLVPVGQGRPTPGAGTGPLGCLPASWRGDLPDAGGSSRWQVDLAADGTFQLRQSRLDRPAPNSVDAIGRWRLEPASQRLVLRGGREAPSFWQPLQRGAALAKLDLEGRPIRSRHNARLRRLAVAEPIEPRLHLRGLFRYLADAPSLELCATGQRLPVAMEGDYLRLERAYLAALPAGAAGQPLLVSLDGLISPRPSREPWQGPVRTLVVERFGRVHPGRACSPSP